MTGLASLLLLGLAILWIGTVAFTAWMLTHPPRRTYASAVARSRPGDPSELANAREFETWGFRVGTNDFPVWDIRGDARQGPTVLMVHGWGDSRIGALARIDAIAPLASRVVAIDLPGHGDAPSICSLGVRERGIISGLIERLQGSGPLVLYGWSLGAGACIAAAADRTDIAAIIAETPYRLPRTPARNVLRLRGLPFRFNLTPAFTLLRILFGPGLADSSFDRAAFARSLRCPLLVLHGDADEVCPCRDGRDIAAAAADAHMAIIASGEHNNLWTHEPHAAACAAAVRSFLRSVPAFAPAPLINSGS